ncbi:MAG: hypothetical protein KC561_11415, partial [Myxococcales bacterium]|nr:hypothetical protein [Myxococcales bacterium]
MLGAACADGVGLRPQLGLVQLIGTDRDDSSLLRPAGVVELPDGRIVLAEAARRTLTVLDPGGQVVERVPIWDQPSAPWTAFEPQANLGHQLVVWRGAFVMSFPGLGPVLVTQDGEVDYLGAGLLGQRPAEDLPSAAANMTDIRGLAVDREDNLLLAMWNQVWRYDGNALSLVAGGSGEFAESVAADQVPFEFGTEVGMAVDSAGRLFLTDAGSGRVWVVADSIASVVAGGGSAISVPDALSPATDFDLNLGTDFLTFDELGRLALLRTNGLLTVELGEPQPGTEVLFPDALVAAAPLRINLPSGMTAGSAGLLITTLDGTLVRLAVSTEGYQRTDLALSELGAGSLFGRLSSVERLGASSLLFHDIGRRQVGLFVEDAGTFVLLPPQLPATPLNSPVAGDDAANVYFVSTRGLNIRRPSGVTSRLAGRDWEQYVTGQPITGTLLPVLGQLTGSGEHVWILDQVSRRAVLVDPVSGALDAVVGSKDGGGRPSAEFGTSTSLLRMTAPFALAARDQALVIADTSSDKTFVYAANVGPEPVMIGGIEVGPDRVELLAGGGEASPSAESPPVEWQLDGLTVLALDDSGVAFAGVGGQLVWLGHEGGVASTETPAEGAPVALSSIDGLIAGVWADGTLAAWNRSDTDILFASETVGPAQVSVWSLDELDDARPVAMQLMGTADQGLVPVVLTDDELLRVFRTISDPDLRTLPGSTLAVYSDATALGLDEGRLFGVQVGEDAVFAGESLGDTPSLLVETNDGWIDGTPVASYGFSSSITFMATAPDLDLLWIDRETNGLFRADAIGREVTDASPISLLTRASELQSQRPILLDA